MAKPQNLRFVNNGGGAHRVLFLIKSACVPHRHAKYVASLGQFDKDSKMPKCGLEGERLSSLQDSSANELRASMTDSSALQSTGEFHFVVCRAIMTDECLVWTWFF